MVGPRCRQPISSQCSLCHGVERAVATDGDHDSLIPLAVLPWVTYLALPVSVNPLLILLPSAALLGVAVCIAAATFKKYL